MLMQTTASLKIATIRGIPLRVHFSLVFLLFYVAFVAVAQFPQVLHDAGIPPGRLPGSPGLWGLGFALALFVSVALHEFGHALMAQSLGSEVRGITLMMLGGVSEIEHIPEKPYGEFKLAIVGPLVSFAIAGALYLIRRRTGSTGVYFFSYWLGNANFVLAIFNLLPAFPLDGGRALRSFLAARQGQLRATQTSVSISKALAWGLGILGFLSFNLLLMFIAFFIHAAAQNELFLLLSKGMLQDMRVGELALRIAPAGEGDTLRDIAARMLATRQPLLPVDTASGRPALVSLAHLRGVDRNLWGSTPVRNVMRTVPKSLDIGDPISQALPEIALTPERALPVTESGHPIGLITFADLTGLLQLKSLEAETPSRAA